MAKQPIPLLIDAYATQAKVDPAVVEAIANTESSFNPQATNGQHYGLFQVSPTDYYGGHYTPEQLLDPVFSLKVVLPHIKAAYDRAIGLGYKGNNLVDYTATHSGFDSAAPLSDTNPKASASYNYSGLEKNYGIAGGSGGTIQVPNILDGGGPGGTLQGAAGNVASDATNAAVSGAASVIKATGQAALPWIILGSVFLVVGFLFLKSFQGAAIQSAIGGHVAANLPSSAPAPQAPAPAPAPMPQTRVYPIGRRALNPGSAIDADYRVVR